MHSSRLAVGVIKYLQMYQQANDTQLVNELVSAVSVLYQSVKQRKIDEYLREIQNVKKENGNRKNI